MSETQITFKRIMVLLKIERCRYVKLYLLLVVGPSNCFKIVKMIMERNFQPVIIFSFSKKECEAYALQMSKLDFNSGKNSIIVTSDMCIQHFSFCKTHPSEFSLRC